MSAAAAIASPQPPVARASSAGFTIVEMMTAIAVLAISLSLAAPALSGFVRSSRVRGAQSELVSSLMLARTEAARRGVPVKVRAKEKPPNSGDWAWAYGWQVWADANNDDTVNGAETLLRDVPDLGSNIAITTNPGGTAVRNAVFSPRGFLVPLAEVTMNVCGRTGDKGYGVRLEPAGLADISELASCP